MGYIMDLRKNIGSRPIIMTSACTLVVDKMNRLLLQRRTDNGCWGLPGGSMELGETFEETAKRELLEETGLKANTMQLFDIFSGSDLYYQYPNGDEVYNAVAAYICSDYQGNLQADGEETSELQFFCIDELPHELQPPDIAILTAFSKKQIK